MKTPAPAPQIGNDFVLTSARDSDGVESVVMYRINKAAAHSSL